MKVILQSAPPYNVSFAEQQMNVDIGAPSVQEITIAPLLESNDTVVSGEEPILTYIAGENLSSGVAVIKTGTSVYKFNPNNPAHAGRFVGVTKTSALLSESVNVQTGGAADDAAFSFAVDSAVFIGIGGELTTAIPATTLVQHIGVSLSATKVLLRYQLPFIRI